MPNSSSNSCASRNGQMPTNPASVLSNRSRTTHNPKSLFSNSLSLVAMASSVFSREMISSSHRKRRTPGLVHRACSAAASASVTGCKSQREVDSSVCKVAVEIRGAAISALRVQGVVGNVADAHPAEPRIQSRRVAIGDRIEHEQGLVAVARGLLGGSHQRLAKALPTRPAVDEHLRQVGAMRLVLGKIEDQLHRAAYPLSVFR